MKEVFRSDLMKPDKNEIPKVKGSGITENIDNIMNTENSKEKEDAREDGAYGEAKKIVFNELDKHNKLLKEEKNKRRNVDPEKMLSISEVATNEDLIKDKRFNGDIKKIDKYAPEKINKN